jgi:hypothetical protein
VTRGTGIAAVVGWMVILVGVFVLADPTHAGLFAWLEIVFAVPLFYAGTLIPLWFRARGEPDDDPEDEDHLPTFWTRHSRGSHQVCRVLGVGLALGWVLLVVHLQVEGGGIDDAVGLAFGLGTIPVCVLAVAIFNGKLESKRARYRRAGRPASFGTRHPWLNAILGD